MGVPDAPGGHAQQRLVTGDMSGRRDRGGGQRLPGLRREEIGIAIVSQPVSEPAISQPGFIH